MIYELLCCWQIMKINDFMNDLYIQFESAGSSWKDAQSAITCSKLAIETLEKGVKYVPS